MNSYLSSAEKCLTMCGLDAFADAMVGSLGVEQRKRTTIGVELAAKASVRFMSRFPLVNNVCYSHNCSFFWMSRHQVWIPKVLGLSWRFCVALRIMDNQFCARECPNYSIMLDFSFVFRIHQVTFDLNFMHRRLLIPVLAFRRTFPGDLSLYFSLFC